jgi:hypothetical protein
VVISNSRDSGSSSWKGGDRKGKGAKGSGAGSSVKSKDGG